MSDMAWRSLRTAGGILVNRRLDLQVHGAGNVPGSGPVIIAARHFHHLYDGAAIVSTISRPVHILVGLDWVKSPIGKKVMDKLCSAAEWPVVLRRDGPGLKGDPEAARQLRRAFKDSLSLLRDGRILLMFPEGYPNIDPGYTPKQDESAFLPFQPGFAQIASSAARAGVSVPIVPAGFSYRRGPKWSVTLNFGSPVDATGQDDIQAITSQIESAVNDLSREHDITINPEAP